MDKNEEDLIVGGYRFATVADAETARLEKKKIENYKFSNPSLCLCGIRKLNM